MKKIIRLLLLVLTMVILVGCGDAKVTEEVKVIVPQGTPFIAVGNLLGEENIKIESVNGAIGAKTALVAQEADVVIAPLNLGAKLYVAGNSKYQLRSVIALGNTYIISNDGTKLDSINDLEGKTILAYGQGEAPDIILKHVLEKNNVNANIEYQASLSEVVPFFLQGKYDYVLAAEPIITNLKVNKGKKLNVLDLQDYTDGTIMQAAVFVNPNSEKQDSIDALIKMIENNIKEMNKNPEQYANSIVNKDVYFSGLGVDILTQSIPNANLSYLSAKNNKDKIESYFNLIKQNLPDEKFYQNR